MPTPEVLSTKVLQSYRIFAIVEQALRLPSGRTVVRQVVQHPGAVVIMPQLEDGRLLLIAQYRFAVGETLREFPAGTLEGSVANFDFRGKIRKSALENSMAYRRQNSRKSNFATEPHILMAVLDVHGGLQNWAKATKITVRMSLGGPFWSARGWPDVYSGPTVTIDPHREHVTFAPFTAPDRMSVLDVGPERVAITTRDGRIVEERVKPRESFPTAFVDSSTPWDAIQVAYFTSAAVWNYLTEPFVFTHPGVEAREIAPWTEEAQTWRRLAVTFPKTIANHNADQVFYYDDAFMLRRTDYSPDVTGNPPVAHYTYDQTTFDGFVFPTRWLVHLHDASGVANQRFAPITIDVAALTVEQA